ncbi:MAG: DUF3391 domain-containing protein [Nitrospirae bacterium]|nr:DUF3391 domain-containing protein [Nitrospirota bacterium]MBF0534899.1 DUF3391 domain-containing protein [Nitrospirota bacterium]MBF0616814.1 DUF3391 domain-containing protein [Nitrospirota bacterium]
MKKRISVDDLRPGMFLDGLDATWYKSPFVKTRFEITGNDQIKKIKDADIAFVFIDTDRGLDVLSAEETLISKTTALENDVSQSPQKSAKESATQKPGPRPQPTLEEYIKKKEALFQIDRSSIISGSFVDFTLYGKSHMNIDSLIEYKGKDIQVNETAFVNYCELMIKPEDIPRYKAYIKDAAKAVGGSQETKHMLVKENARMCIKELFDNPHSDENVQQSKEVTEGIINAILESKGLITNLLTINKKDFYTYSHSVNLSVLSVATAVSSGVTNDGELFAIGMGCLLHDIGKTTIPPEIMAKPVGKLSRFEMDIFKEHVAEGYNILKLYKGISEATSHPLLEHHEKISGTGYPNGLSGSKMHTSGKIAALVDLYDILTTSRPGYKGMSAFEALSHLRSLSVDYDPDVLKEFIKILGKTTL